MHENRNSGREDGNVGDRNVGNARNVGDRNGGIDKEASNRIINEVRRTETDNQKKGSP